MTTITESAVTPTQQWMANTAAYMPPLNGAAGTAERLLLMLHFSIDWNVSWAANYRTSYWDKQLPERVFVAAHQSSTLREWWSQLAEDFVAAPTTPQARIELAQLLDDKDPRAVLRCLAAETLALVMRTRIVAEAKAAKRKKR